MMAKIKLTPPLIYAAATDAGNLSMRAGGRLAWSAEDYAAACHVFKSLSTGEGELPPIKAKRRKCRLAVKQRLLIRYNHRCAYCGRSITLETMTVDHHIPVSAFHGMKAGHLIANQFENLRPAHAECNAAKGDRIPKGKSAKRKPPKQLLGGLEPRS